MKKIITHEDYIKSIKELVCDHANAEDQAKLNKIKLVYGAGSNAGARGITMFNRWEHNKTDQTDLVEICAMGEENLTQLAGTTVHELAHVVAGMGKGHDKDWKRYCDVLGLRNAKAAGMVYQLANFAPWLRQGIVELPISSDGKPSRGLAANPFTFHNLRGCTLGIGTHGGKSRGKGSGSRLRLYTCECKTKIRVASDTFDATCNVCKTKFKQDASKLLMTTIFGLGQ